MKILTPARAVATVRADWADFTVGQKTTVAVLGPLAAALGFVAGFFAIVYVLALLPV